MRALVIIPAYNEEDNILKVVNEVKSNKVINVDYVVINDCSTDTTKEILHNNDVPFLDLPVNLGIGGCVQTGFRYAQENQYDVVVQFDGDGQHDASYISELINPICDNIADVVIGSRYIACEGFQSSVTRRIGISIISRLIYILSGVKVLDVTSGMRAYNRDMIKFLADNYEDDYPEPDALLAAALRNMRILEIPVQMRERAGGTSSITAGKSVYYMIKVCSSLVIMKIMDTWRGNDK